MVQPMTFQGANIKNPNMGLDNKICNNPKYWCTAHEIWLFEQDAIDKGCFNKMTFDMLSVRRCVGLVDRNYYDWLNQINKQRGDK